MDARTFYELQTLAKHLARRRGFKHLGDDFAQVYCLNVWRGSRQPLRLQFIDFLRKEYGRTDKYAYEGDLKKSHARLNQVLYEETKHAVPVCDDIFYD